MRISLGNAVYNHKPTQQDMVWHSGFLDAKKNPIDCPILDDTAENYAFAFAHGICVKGYRFMSIKDIYKRTFVCDFDNLTEEQYYWIVNRIKNCQMKRIKGSDSSGMKFDRYWGEKQDPNWKPSKFRYKVFFPLDEFYSNSGVICVREKVEKAYFDVVQFFNPQQTRERVEEVAKKWLEANNQSIYYKHGPKKGLPRKNHPTLTIEDKDFEGWILPDPVEVTNPRHQITYSISPELPDPHYFLTDEDWQKILNSKFVARYPSSSKFNFCSEIYLPYDLQSDIESTFWSGWEKNKSDFQIDQTLKEQWRKMLQREFTRPIQDSESLSIPTSKSGMAKHIGKYEWSDLVFDFKTSATVNQAIYSEWEHGFNYSEISDILKQCVKFLTRCEAEVERESNTLSQENVGLKVIDNLPILLRKIFGKDFWASMDQKKLDSIVKQVIRELHYYIQTFKHWRKQRKWGVVLQRDDFQKEWQDIREKYLENSTQKNISANKLAQIKEVYDQERKEFYKKVDTEAKLVRTPYIYTRRGLKKELIGKALNVGPMNQENFVNFAMNELQANDGLVEIGRVEGWYRDYRSQFNKTNAKTFDGDFCEDIYNQLGGMVLEMDGTIHKKHKEHKEHRSKYKDILSKMSQDEALKWIESSDLSRMQKKRLREWVCSANMGVSDSAETPTPQS